MTAAPHDENHEGAQHAVPGPGAGPKTNIFLIRHGQSTINAACQALTADYYSLDFPDAELTETGVRQAQQIADAIARDGHFASLLKFGGDEHAAEVKGAFAQDGEEQKRAEENQFKPDVVVCSTLRRALETATVALGADYAPPAGSREGAVSWYACDACRETQQEVGCSGSGFRNVPKPCNQRGNLRDMMYSTTFDSSASSTPRTREKDNPGEPSAAPAKSPYVAAHDCYGHVDFDRFCVDEDAQNPVETFPELDQRVAKFVGILNELAGEVRKRPQKSETEDVNIVVVAHYVFFYRLLDKFCLSKENYDCPSLHNAEIRKLFLTDLGATPRDESPGRYCGEQKDLVAS